MKNIHILVFLFLATVKCFSQSTGIRRLKAQRIDNFLRLSVNHSGSDLRLFYETDGKNGFNYQFPLSGSEKDALVLGVKKDQLNITFDFLNPLKYNVELTEETKDDPNYIAANKFIMAFLALQNSITKDKDIIAAFEEDRNQENTKENKDSKVSKSDTSNSDILKSDSNAQNLVIQTAIAGLRLDNVSNLLMWYYELRSEKKVIDFPDFSTKIEAIESTLTKPFKVIKSDSENDTYLEHLKDIASIMRKTEEFTIISDINKIGNIIEGLDKRNQNLENQLVDFKKMIPDPLKIKNLTEITLTPEMKKDKSVPQQDALKLKISDSLNIQVAFNNYAKSSMGYYYEKVNDILTTRKKTVNEARNLLERIKDFTEERRVTEDNRIVFRRKYTIDKIIGKVKNLHIRIIENEIKTDDLGMISISHKTEKDGFIEIVDYSKAIAEFSGGFFYSDLAFPKFGTTNKNGALVAVQSGEDRPLVFASAMLNIVFDYEWGPAFPMLQLGVGTGKDRPTLLLGGGIRFFKPLKDISLSAGMAWSWLPELNSEVIKIGETPITGTADIEKNIQYRFSGVPKPYLGFQFNF